MSEMSASHDNSVTEKAAKDKAGTALMKLFLDEINDVYGAEQQLVKALPKLKSAAASPELAGAFSDHLEQTKTQVVRLEMVFGLLGKKAKSKKCKAMEGLAREAASVISDTQKDTSVRDVALILTAQKIEHYEIASYGSLTQLAKLLKLKEVAGLLGTTLQEEKNTDALLTFIAKKKSNREAAGEA